MTKNTFLILIASLMLFFGASYLNYKIQLKRMNENLINISNQIEFDDPVENTKESKPTQTPEPKEDQEYQVFYGKKVVIGSAEYYWELGFDAYSKKKNWQKGKEYYQKALEIDPDYVPALSSLGFIIGAFENRYDEGEAMIQRAIELDPNWAYAPFNLGMMLDLKGEQEKGVEWVEYTIANFPNHPNIEHFKYMLGVMKET